MGLTLSIWLSATPAMPAMPEPSPKVSASTRPVRMPMAAAMRRFCVTARICRPSGAADQHEEQRREDQQAEDDDPDAVVGDGEPAEIERAAHPGGLPTSRLLGPKIVRTACCRMSADAPGGQQGFQRPAVEEADDAALDGDADRAGEQERRGNGDQQRQSKAPGA